MLRDSGAAKILKKHVSFEVDAPQRSSKALFQGTSLRTALSRMSSENIAPTGLKHQECERRRGGEKATIQYVPKWDLVQEALELKPKSLKCTLTNGQKPDSWFGPDTILMSSSYCMSTRRLVLLKIWGCIQLSTIPKQHMTQKR